MVSKKQKEKKKEKRKVKDDSKKKDIPKYKCRSCGKPMFKPNKQCNPCKHRKGLMSKANKRGLGKYTFVERKKLI